jgi:hypothetical protein
MSRSMIGNVVKQLNRYTRQALGYQYGSREGVPVDASAKHALPRFPIMSYKIALVDEHQHFNMKHGACLLKQAINLLPQLDVTEQLCTIKHGEHGAERKGTERTQLYPRGEAGTLLGTQRCITVNGVAIPVRHMDSQQINALRIEEIEVSDVVFLMQALINGGTQRQQPLTVPGTQRLNKLSILNDKTQAGGHHLGLVIQYRLKMTTHGGGILQNVMILTLTLSLQVVN